MKLILVFIFLLIFSTFAVGQFTSGSTGADGALDLSTMTCPYGVCTIQLPESGILNYTTVNIPSGKTLKFKSNARNTPVILLAQGNVTIGGGINLDANFNIPGPGGFYGGQPNLPGFGPGGGTLSSNADFPGKWIGPLSLVPIVGGSGGAGIWDYSINVGGGGGGALVIASSTSITYEGQLSARGFAGGYLRGVGSGGAVRFVSNTINFSGSLDACGGNCGAVRFEATSLSFTGQSSPPAVLAPINPNVVSGNQPQLTIVSVGGYSVPSYAGSRFDTVDLLLPNQIPDPVNIVIQAMNIPAGTEVQVGFVSGSPGGSSTTCTLSGGPGPLSCTATISNLNRTGVTYLLATAAFNPPLSLAKHNPKGENQVAKIKLETVLGAKPKYIFLSKKGTVINNAKISENFLQFFGI